MFSPRAIGDPIFTFPKTVCQHPALKVSRFPHLLLFEQGRFEDAVWGGLLEEENNSGLFRYELNSYHSYRQFVLSKWVDNKLSLKVFTKIVQLNTLTIAICMNAS